MPISKSAKKALRQSDKKRVKNYKARRQTKSLVKQMRVLASKDQKKEALELLPQAYKALDKAAKQGIIKKNTAARRKSRITALLSKEKTKEEESQTTK